jgi:N-acetylneuraminic acid mutarotase
VSLSSNRSAPVALAGQSVSGNIYVFTSPDTSDIRRVRFWLDNPTMPGQPRQSDRTAPYDFAGGSATTAKPFDTRTVADGTHTITAAIEFSTGETVVHGSFTVSNNTQPPQPGAYSLKLSTSANRTSAINLSGATVSGNIYVFTSPETSEIVRVRFYLDNPAASGSPRHTETTAPYDFAGGTASSANPFDTKTLPDGLHTITAAIDLSAGGTELVNGPFTVANSPPADTVPPAAPSNVVAAPGNSKVTLAWTANTEADLAGYNVYRGTGTPVSRSAPLNGSSLLTSNSYVDSGAVNGTTYYYVVEAVDTAGNKAAAEAVSATPQATASVDLHVNFQSETAPVPAGYLRDFGQAYGARTGTDQGNGLVYGWIRQADLSTPLSLVGNGRDRNVNSDQRLDTLVHMQLLSGSSGGVTTPGAWQIAVPNGGYQVTVSVGDSGGALDSTHRINVEGQVLFGGFQPTASDKFYAATKTVNVADGTLTIDAGGGSNTKINYAIIRSDQATDRPSVTQSTPSDGATNVSRDTPVTAEVHLPNVGGIDANTLNAATVRLIRTNDGTQVPANVNTSGGGDVIVLTSTVLLEVSTRYRFEVTNGVKDLSGAAFLPYSSDFVTGTAGGSGGGGVVQFEKVVLPPASGKSFTSVTMGPDGKLYAGTIEGEIVRFTLNADGTLAGSETINSIQNANGGSRMLIGLAFDPSSTAGNLILWTSHTAFAFSNGPDWTGKITRLSGPNLTSVQDYVVGLPRSYKDHLTNSLAFGPGGKLYVTQGSNTAMGAPDNAWGLRPERLLTAAVLRVDLGAITSPPLDVKTADTGTYDPFAAGAPVTIYASGVRNAFDLLWHSNGQLYVPTNGSASGGNTPGTPSPLPSSCQRRIDEATRGDYTGPQVIGLSNVSQVQHDYLFRVVQGGYYGHPNPERCEWVLNGGNPSTGNDPAQVGAYPVGTNPDRNWRGSAFDFGEHFSPNGVIEYKNGAFGGALQGKLLVTRYSAGDDLVVLTPGSGSPDIVDSQTGIVGFTGFTDPLDLVENPSKGHIYVSEFGGQKITLLRPIGGPATDGPEFDAQPSELVFSGVKGTTSAAQSILMRNTGDAALQITNAALVGVNASSFRTINWPSMPVTLTPGQTVSFGIAFSPSSTTVGSLSAAIDLTTNDVDEANPTIGLYGLSANGLEGSNEPPLKQVVDTLGHPINVGGTGLILGTSSTPIGDEVLVPLFQKAQTGAVGIKPVARYSPDETLPFGYYTANVGSPVHSQLATIAAGQHQTLNPAVVAGGADTFDPGVASFGLYVHSNTFGRKTYTEDRLNTGPTTHAVRVYPAKNRSDQPLANTYIVAFEDASNGDYQDYVFRISNVKPATSGGTTTYDLVTSSSSNRANAVTLAGKSVSGNVYVFTTPATGVSQVRFYLDNTLMTGSPRIVESLAPYDFAGTASDGTANPFNTNTISNGSHVITAAIDRSAGGTEVLHATFTVDNAPPTSSNLFAWTTKAASPIARSEAQGTTANGKLYVFGGFISGTCCIATTRSDVFDPATNTWTRIADLPEPITHAPAVVDGDTIYLVGGYVGDHPGPATSHVWKYDVKGNTWSAGPDLPASRGAGAAARLGRELHYFGGHNRGEPFASDKGNHYVLSLDGGTSWSTAESLPNPRNHLTGATAAGKIYAIGGQHEHDEVSGNQAEVDAYDPATNSWTQVADLPAPRGHVSSTVRNGRILAIGGTINGDAPSAAVTAYDPATDVWVKLQSLPAARKTPVTGLIGDELIIATGADPAATATAWSGVFRNTWEFGSSAPLPLGEVAGGIVRNALYLVGEQSSATLALDLSTGAWRTVSSAAPRPFTGHHHAAEVVGGKFYLLGGLGNAAGKVQIYNPATNNWSLGADMPFAAGSSASAVIGGSIYVAGGIVGTSTTTAAAKYNPATNTWTSIAPMKQARNHAAAATDGAKLYVFGGRGPGSGDSNTVANGFDTVQIYDPATNTWVSSLDAGSTLAPLPQARGGMGKAVYYNGKFYVLGGETESGSGATANNVYNRVDIYDPATNTWRLGPPMPTARHGIFPLEIGGRIYVAGGGVQAGASSSSVLEIYNPD